jgi:hypothetical protein
MANPAGSANLDLLGDGLASDVERSLHDALEAGAVFPAGSDPLGIFRNTLAESIRDIENHERGLLLQRFLLQGPYEDGGTVPAEMVSQRLSDDDTAVATAFIFGFMVNSFKGALMELLACAPCLRLVRSLQERGRLAGSERLYVGDSVLAASRGSAGFAKGADFHILTLERSGRELTDIAVAGVAEVKSYSLSQRRIRRQLGRHLRRALLGLRVGDDEVPPGRIHVGDGQNRTLRIAVVPSSWKLPRTLAVEEIEGRKLLYVEEPEPRDEDRIRRTTKDEWRIVLRWSQEAIAAAAYEVTFWYMEKVGEVIYRSDVPADWSEMTPAEAGRNAVKMMLYYAILRALPGVNYICA